MYAQREKPKENKSSGNSYKVKESQITSGHSTNKSIQMRSYNRAGRYVPGQSGYNTQVVNNTGLPSQLKSGMEQTTGYDLSRVKVHYNSPKPATVQAHAYAQGSDIHLGVGQERHLSHELGHVVQQMSGMVRPTIQCAGMQINDDPQLEQHADQLAAKALSVSMQLTSNKETQESRADSEGIVGCKNGHYNVVAQLSPATWVKNNTIVEILKIKGGSIFTTSTWDKIKNKIITYQKINEQEYDSRTAELKMLKTYIGNWYGSHSDEKKDSSGAKDRRKILPDLINKIENEFEEINHDEKYNELNKKFETEKKNPSDDKESIKNVLKEIKYFQNKYPEFTKEIENLNNYYHMLSVSMLRLDGVADNRQQFSGQTDTLKYAANARRDNVPKGQKIYGTQGYKLHISYENSPVNVDKVVTKLIPKLKDVSWKIINNPEGLRETQENKYITIYPTPDEKKFENVQLHEQSDKFTITYYEAGIDKAKDLADILEQYIKEFGINKGGAVPKEDKLNDWTYTRFGSFTAKETYKVVDKMLIIEQDVR